ncbi:MAG TPA: heterodisulfide reductase-related iron-sulfur binding cluster, partial [Xanthobacteraceae bacterium]|nr:heterodisulfide reductase-related iron-sulfur binding cluster [Xanthobacteraceae bacterium]
MTTCAVKVDYAHLIDIGRAYIETNYRRPVSERALRWLLASVLPYPRRFAAALFLARMAGPIAGLLPSRLRNLITLAQEQKSAGEVLRPTVLAPTGAKRRRVALLPGCAQQALNRNINAATIRILQRHGCEVVIAPGIACCGALPLH